jgi:hypothetical protein
MPKPTTTHKSLYINELCRLVNADGRIVSSSNVGIPDRGVGKTDEKSCELEILRRARYIGY